MVIYVKFVRDAACQEIISRPMFHGVIQKITVAQFFLRGVVVVVVVVTVVHLFANKMLQAKNMAGYQKAHQRPSKLAT